MKRFIVLMVILCIVLSSFCVAAIPNGVEVLSYNKTTDYMAHMIATAEDGSNYALSMGAIYERQRNMKIASEEIDCNTTDIFTKYDTADKIKLSLFEYLGKKEPVIVNTYYTDEDVAMIAKTMYNEARGISNKVELACIAWTILNRVDAGQGTIKEVVTAPYQFAYSSDAKTTNDHGIDLIDLSNDVLGRWTREKNGETDIGRVLPLEFKYFGGNGRSNTFRTQYNTRTATYWNYSLPSPY